jgi:putative endonuclease
MFYTYVIKSESIGKLYIGQSQDYETRLYKHNTNQNKWTKGKGPWKLLGYIEHETRREAILLERKLKSWKNPKRVEEWLTEHKSG